MTIASTAVVLGVHLDDAEIGDFVVLGEQPGGGEARVTTIGAGAHIRSHTVIYAGNTIGVRFSTGHHVLVREDNTIGDDVSIGSGTVVEHHITLGDGVRIHSQAFVPEHTTIADGAWIGPRVTFTNARYPRSVGVKESLAGAHVGRRAKVGANATILPGLSIGEDALVGAGAVVVHDVPPRAVVVGNPARIVGSVEDLPYPEVRA